MPSGGDCLTSVVLDVGSARTKAGYSGEEAAREVFRSVVGVPRHPGTRATLLGHPADLLAGDEAYAAAGTLTLTAPVRGGRLADREGYERLLHYALYTRLRAVPERRPLLLLEPADRTRAEREAIAEMLFEGASVPLVGLLSASAATVYSTGRTTGLALDSGAGQTVVGAVVDGYTLPHTLRTSPVAGDYLTDELARQLRARGYPLSGPADRDLVEAVKEARCRAALDPAAEREAAAAAAPGAGAGAAYELPDGERVFLFEGETQVAEHLFDPSLLRAGAGENENENEAAGRPLTPTGFTRSNPGCRPPPLGWAGTVASAIAASPAGVQEQLYQNVVLGGGTSAMRDVERRLQRELLAGLRADPPSHFEGPAAVKCVAFPERAQAAWIGGSVFACSSSFPHLCLSKAEYHDAGPAAVHQYTF